MPVKTDLMVFQCPSCAKTLVAGTQTCQFCGKPTGQVGRTVVQQVQRQQGPTMAWQEAAYWVLAWIWVASGLFGVVQALGMVPVMGGFFGPWATLNLIIGLGLLTQSEWIIWFAKILTYLNVVGALIGLLFSMMLKHPLDIAISVGYNACALALACFQIYIFGYMSD